MIAFVLAASGVAAQSDYSLKTIVLDAGHGGHDSGCRGVLVQEKDVTLDIALLTEQMLRDALPGVQIIQTRRSDVFLPLHERAQIANKHRADLFVSIHCNASKSSSPYGTETYLMGLHVSDENLEVSMRENSVVSLEKNYESHYEGFDPHAPETFIMLSMNQSAFLNQSIELASLIEKEFARKGRHSRGVKQAGFLVLWRVTMPAVLVEVGFLSNRNEERFLASEDGKKQIASAITRAVVAYKQRMEGPAADDADAVVSSNPDPEPVGNPTAGAASGTVYRIQLYAASQRLSPDDARFAAITDSVLVEKTDKGLYRYLAGSFLSVQEAEQRLKHYRQNGFKDAFLVRYQSGVRLQ